MGKTSTEKDELEIDDISVMALKGVFKKIFLDDLKNDLDRKTEILCLRMSEIKNEGQSSKNIIEDLAKKYELKPLELENSFNPESTNETVLGDNSDINDVILAYLEYSAKQNKIISDSLALQMKSGLTEQNVLIEKRIGGINDKISNYRQTHTEWQTKNEQQNQQLKTLIIGTSTEEQKNLELKLDTLSKQVASIAEWQTKNEQQNEQIKNLVIGTSTEEQKHLELRIDNLAKDITNIKEKHELQQLEQEKVKEKAKLTVYTLMFAVILLLCLQGYQVFFK